MGDLGSSEPFADNALQSIGAATLTLEHLNIGGFVPIADFAVDAVGCGGANIGKHAECVPPPASGVFSNIHEDAPILDRPTSSSDSDNTEDPALGSAKIGKKHRTTKNKFNKIINFGRDCGMADLAHIAATMLVGKVRGRKYSNARLKQWTREIWGGSLDTLPEVLLLTKGWFSLTFAQPEQSDWALMKYWHIEMHPVHLKRWVPLFDPNKENAGAGTI